jgi:metal-responsive CopG/Arc/MetJ family transcriptional regulator
VVIAEFCKFKISIAVKGDAAEASQLSNEIAAKRGVKMFKTMLIAV